MLFMILTYQYYHTTLHMSKKDLQYISGFHEIKILHVHCTCIRVYQKKNPCIDNFHKIRVDTQYLYTYSTTQYITVDTQEHNSYIYMCFYLAHTYQRVSLPSVKVCVHVRNPWYTTEGLSPSEGGRLYI